MTPSPSVASRLDKLERRLSSSTVLLQEALQKGDIEKAKNFLLSDPHLGRERIGPESRTPLLTSCVLGSPLAEWLISFGGHERCRETDEDGRSPLHLAAKYGHLHIVETLLRSDGKALLYLQDRQKETALHLACAAGHVDVVDALMARGKSELACIENMWGLQALELADKEQRERLRTVVNYHCFAERFSAEAIEAETFPRVRSGSVEVVDNETLVSLKEDVKQLKGMVQQLQLQLNAKDEAISSLTSMVLDLSRRERSSSGYASLPPESSSPKEAGTPSTPIPTKTPYDLSPSKTLPLLAEWRKESVSN